MDIWFDVFAATDTSSHRDWLLSLIHAANRKLRLRDKSKSVENNAAFVPSISGRSKSTTQVHCILNAADVELPRCQQGNAVQAVSIRHYPAYHYDANRNAISLATDNCKTSLMRRAARSYESLSSVQISIAENSSRSGATFPLAYRSLNS